MLKELLSKQMVQFVDDVGNWEEAIRSASLPLLENGYIENRYIDSMIHNVHEFGPYIVLLPQIAMPHSRPEAGVKKLGVSVLITEKSVVFPGQKEASVFIVLAAADSTSHLELLSELMEVFSDEQKVAELIKARTYQDLCSIL